MNYSLNKKIVFNYLLFFRFFLLFNIFCIIEVISDDINEIAVKIF